MRENVQDEPVAELFPAGVLVEKQRNTHACSANPEGFMNGRRALWPQKPDQHGGRYENTHSVLTQLNVGCRICDSWQQSKRCGQITIQEVGMK